MSSANRAKEIFLSAIELPDASRRDAFVVAACNGDDGLRQEVVELISAHLEADSLLDKSRIEPKFLNANRPDMPETLPSKEVRPGVQIGPYKLLEQVGSGGMGVVYMAEQQKPIRRKVAIKIIKPGMDTMQVVARFEAERQALAMMDHPNIAHVLDAGTTEFQRPYFVMELVRGIPITEYCDKNKLTTQERLKLFAIVCQAVQHAHTKGIIHRDIKPSNILVTLHDGIPVPKIIDFGVAKATNQQLTDRTLFTSINQFVGTPLYMSPEQAEMSGLDVDTRSDIYSLGVLLYELLTGTTPFDRQRFHAAALDEVRRIIRDEEPQKPSTRVSSMGDSNATVSAQRSTDPVKLKQVLRNELDWIVMKTLEKDRTRRYETASALVAEVNRYLNGEPVEACPPSTTYRLRKFVLRHRMAATVATAFLLLILGSAAVAWWLYGDAKQSRDNAVAAQRLSLKERDRALEAEKSAETNLQLATREKTRADKQAIDLKHKLYDYNVIKADAAYRDNQVDNAMRLLNDCMDEQRGWEWRYLNRLTGGRRSIFPPCDPIVEFALTQDGQRVVAIDRLGMMYMINAADGSIVWTTRTRIGVAWGLVFSPDSQSVVVVGCTTPNDSDPSKNQGVIQLVAAEKGNSLWEHSIPNAVAKMPQFRPDGKSISSTVDFNGQGVSQLQVRQAGDGGILWTKPTKPIAQAIFDASGERIFLSEAQGSEIKPPSTVRCLSTADGNEVWSFERPTELSGLTVSPNGLELIGGGPNHSITVWDPVSGVKKYQVEGASSDSVLFLRISADGKRLLTVGLEGQAVVWDWETKRPIESFNKIALDPFLAHITPDGKQLVYVDKVPNVINFRSVRPPSKVVQLLGHAPGYKGARFVDNETLISAGPEGALRTWNARTGQELKSSSTGKASLELACSPDGRLIATATTEGAKLWERSSGKLLQHWNDLGETWFVKFANQGSVLAAAGKNGVLKLWSTDEGREISQFQAATSIHGIAITQDSSVAVTLSSPGCEVVSWNLVDRSRNVLREPQGSQRGRSVEISPDGKLIAVGVDRTVELWALKEKRLITSLSGFSGLAVSLAFDTTGKRLFVGTADGFICVWNVETSEMLLSFRAHDSQVTSVALTPDNMTLVSSSHSGELKLWESIEADDEVLHQRSIVQKATEIINQKFSQKLSSREILNQLAEDRSIEQPEVLSMAIAIANTRSSGPISTRAYSPAAPARPQPQLTNVHDTLADASQKLSEFIDSTIAGYLDPLTNFDDKRLNAGRWHTMAQTLSEKAISGIDTDEFSMLLDYALELPDPPHYLIYIQGVTQAKLGQWSKAEENISRALAMVPRRTKLWHEYAYRLAFLRAYLEKWDAYNELCQMALDDFQDTEDEKLAERTSKMCLFTKESRIDPVKAGELADRAWGQIEKSTIAQYTEMAKGIADLRRQSPEKAVEHLESSLRRLQLSSSPGTLMTIAATQLYLSIAYKTLDRTDEAQKLLVEASQVINSSPDNSIAWNDWMNAKLILMEAENAMRAEPDAKRN